MAIISLYRKHKPTSLIISKNSILEVLAQHISLDPDLDLPNIYIFTEEFSALSLGQKITSNLIHNPLELNQSWLVRNYS